MPSVMQRWTHKLSYMQQAVLLTAVRGPDGVAKYGCVKNVVRWYRRSVLRIAFTGKELDDPFEAGGGSFTGPVLLDNVEPSLVLSEYYPRWYTLMGPVVDGYFKEVDALPHHFQTHLMHASHIVGAYHRHPDISGWWMKFYLRYVRSLHLQPETLDDMEKRLSDNRNLWLSFGDYSTSN